MYEPYQTPRSDSLNAVPPREYLHVLYGTLSSAVVVIILVFWEPGTQSENLQMLFTGAICCLISGGLLLCFHKLRWFLAVLIGPPVTLILIFLAVMVAWYFGIML
jgi:hypothetical protein